MDVDRVAARQLQGTDGDDFVLRVGALTDPWLRVAGVELAAIYYAFVGPRRRRPLGPDEFSYSEKTGLGGLLFGAGLMVTMEGLAVHFVIHLWSAATAWILAAINGYTLIWLAAAFQAARLRPVALSADRLLIRETVENWVLWRDAGVADLYKAWIVLTLIGVAGFLIAQVAARRVRT